jgi:hypothetical protein
VGNVSTLSFCFVFRALCNLTYSESELLLKGRILIWEIGNCQDLYSYGLTTWQVSDRYERLATVAAEVLATPCWKYLFRVSILDSGSSYAVENTVLVTWKLCLYFRIHFCCQRLQHVYSCVSLLDVKCVLNDYTIAVTFLALWRYTHDHLFAHTQNPACRSQNSTSAT